MTEKEKQEVNEAGTVFYDSQQSIKEICNKIWKGRRLIIKSCIIAFVVAVIIIISVPKEYETTVMLAPEFNNPASSSNMGALAALAGVNTNKMPVEALSPMIYPEIVHSTPFIIELVDINVQDKSHKINTTFFDYMENHQRTAWWNYIVAVPYKVVGGVKSLFASPEVDTCSSDGLNPFRLSKKQALVLDNINRRISVHLDTKTGIAKISVKMQDPVITAVITDSVMINLQNYITAYRTNKSKKDLEFSEQLFEEAKQDYVEAQQRYARFVDRNQGIALQSYRSEEERLRNEINLSFGVYNQAAQSLAVAKAAVQEITPVFTVVEPSKIPVNAAYPRKMFTLVVFMFLAVMFSMGWILIVKDLFSKRGN